jgi:L-lactate dehydrogenase complex protein LldF
MKGAALLFADGHRLGYAVKAGSVANRFVTMVSRRTLPGGRTAIGRIPGPGASAWTGARDLPAPPRESFRSWWAKTDGGRNEAGPT